MNRGQNALEVGVVGLLQAAEVPAAVRRSLAADPGTAPGDDGPIHRKADAKEDAKTVTAETDDGPDDAKSDTAKPDVPQADTVKNKKEQPGTTPPTPHRVPGPTAKKASG